MTAPEPPAPEPAAIEPPAATTLLVRLQVGRVLRGRLLIAASVVGALARMVATFGFWDELEGPPAFVVVQERGSGVEVRRFSVGRDPEVARVLLARVQDDLEGQTRARFLATWPRQSRLEPAEP